MPPARGRKTSKKRKKKEEEGGDAALILEQIRSRLDCDDDGCDGDGDDDAETSNAADRHIFDYGRYGDFLKFHPLVEKSGDEDDDEDEEQTYSEFVEIGNRPPNESGTGRNKLTKRRRQISILNLSKRMGSKRCGRLQMFLRAFFPGLTAVTHISTRDDDHGGDPKGKKKNIGKGKGSAPKMEIKKTALVDYERGLEFPIGTLRSSSGGEDGRRRKKLPLLDVFSVFDILVEYVSEKDYAVVAIVDQDIGERHYDDEDDDDGGIQVLGRACGDRVAVVQYEGPTSATSDVDFFATVTHEILHTMGFDHTTFWNCLMNPGMIQVVDDDDEDDDRDFRDTHASVFLCPHNLKKLRLFLNDEEEKDDGFVLSRYERMSDGWWKMFPDGKCKIASYHYDWLRRKIDFLQQNMSANTTETLEDGTGQGKKKKSTTMARKKKARM